MYRHPIDELFQFFQKESIEDGFRYFFPEVEQELRAVLNQDPESTAGILADCHRYNSYKDELEDQAVPIEDFPLLYAFHDQHLWPLMSDAEIERWEIMNLHLTDLHDFIEEAKLPKLLTQFNKYKDSLDAPEYIDEQVSEAYMDRVIDAAELIESIFSYKQQLKKTPHNYFRHSDDEIKLIKESNFYDVLMRGAIQSFNQAAEMYFYLGVPYAENNDELLEPEIGQNILIVQKLRQIANGAGENFVQALEDKLNQTSQNNSIHRHPKQRLLIEIQQFEALQNGGQEPDVFDSSKFTKMVLNRRDTNIPDWNPN